MERIKVAYIVSSLANEGPVNVMYNIIKYIDFDKFDVFVISLIPEKGNSRINDFEKLPIKIKQFAVDDKTSIISLYFKVKKYLSGENIEVLHAHCWRSLLLLYLFKNKYKKVYTAHIYPGIQQRFLYGELVGPIFISMCNFLMLKMDLPIACSESVSKEFFENKGWKIKAINNGSSLPVWEGTEKDRIQIRKKLNLKETVKYFIFIGRFSGEKKPDFIIESFLRINDPSVGLIMLGDGPLLQSLSKFQSEKIRLEGFKTNVYEYLIASDYYISASDTEGLANTLLESMTVGLPMLLSNIPSHELILGKESDKLGFLFNNTEPVELDESIKEIVKLDRSYLSSQIKKVYKNKYTAQQMSDLYQIEYKRIVN